MIKKIYLFFSTLTLITIALSTALLFALSHPESVAYIAKDSLKESGVEYKEIKGSLFKGVSLHDVKYADAVDIKTLEIEYNPFMFFFSTLRVKEIRAEGLHIDLKNLPAFVADNSEKSTFSLHISKLQLKDINLMLDKETLSFDLNASDIYHSDTISVKKLSLNLLSSYGKVNINGNIKSNRLNGDAIVELENSVSKEYIGFLKDFPEKIALNFDITKEKALITTHLGKTALSAEENLNIDRAVLKLIYFIDDDYFRVDSEYKLSYFDFESDIKQSVILTFAGCYSSEVNATITKEPIELPFKTFSAEIAGDNESIVGAIDATPLKFHLLSKDYNNFALHAESKNLKLSFVPNLPEILQKNILSFKSDASVNISPFSSTGTFITEGLYSNVDGKFEIDKQNSLFEANIKPKLENEVWKKYPIEKFLPFKATLYSENQNDTLNLNAGLLNLTLLKKDTNLLGVGNIGSTDFKAKGIIVNEEKTDIEFLANITSLNSVLSELNLYDDNNDIFYDGKIDINATIAIEDKIKIKTRLNVPWIILKPDAKKNYSGKNIFIESTIVDKQITIDSYGIDFMGHNIYSKKPSKLSIDNNGSIEFKKFWIYDNLLLTGEINPLHSYGNLKFKSDGFKYESTDANVTLKADIQASFEENATQSIKGTLTLLDGVITHLPATDYTISDSDIVIIQDIKKKDENRLLVNIHINSLKPIEYKVKDIDIKFTPDFTLLQEPYSKFKLYGMLTIDEGEISGGGKEFVFDKSEIYFYGGDPINPYLNLNLHHYTVDYIDIEIFVTNTLSSPVLIFSSKPFMSQNDIMSYILFGEAASSLFDTTGEGSTKASINSLILGAGLKQIFNETTGIKVDTLNILTNKEGTLGYEIGARFNKQIRVVYINDTISSVILQYSLSKSLRIDVDVHESGQGVSIIYIKDF